MKRWGVLLYGVTCYLIFFGVFLYLAGFMGNLFVPKPMDGAATGSPWTAAMVDLGLVAIFGLQHSIIARPAFKRWWTRFVPKPIERSTYVLATNLVLIVLFAFWQPTGMFLWDLDSQIARNVVQGLFAVGLLIVLVTTFLLNHFDLFGLRQVWLYFRGEEYRPVPLRNPGPYRFVRHPLYVGWILSFWATPTMSLAHFAFAAGMTVYILIAIVFEERNLADEHGAPYLAYRANTPMLIPRLTGSANRALDGDATKPANVM